MLTGLAALSLLAVGCGAAPESAQVDDVTGTQYVDAVTFLQTSADPGAWAQMVTTLEGNFYDVCGDTFCGGDYSNLTSLGLTCAVSSKVGQLHDCVWTFAGTSELVNPTTGALTISKPTFQCHFTADTRVPKLVSTLLAPGSDPALRRPLPGGTTSIYDAIGECFQHPIGATPLSPVYTKTPSYSVEIDVGTTDVDGWFAAERTLDASFAAACPGSYCADKYENLTGLRMICATSIKTNNIKSCAWVVTGSKATVSASKGTVAVAATSYRCSLPMKGPANDLSALINADQPTPVLDRVLPGSTKTLRNVLDTCL
jgi:hypothetical protein